MKEEIASERIKITPSLKEKVRRDATKNKKQKPRSHNAVIEMWYLGSHSTSFAKKGKI